MNYLSTTRFCAAIAFFLSITSQACLAAATAPITPISLEEDGVRFERVNQATFQWKSILKVYDIALHLKAGESPKKLFNDMPMRLHLKYHRAFTAAEIIKGGNTLLERNADAATLIALNGRLNRINAAYRDVKPGDSYTLTYTPEVGTTLRLNGKQLATIPGHDFAATYFRIWLGKDPISKPLRDKLLKQ
jgi:Chalcone isomerase-like